MFVGRSEFASNAHQYFQTCLSAIAKQEDIERIVARHRTDGTQMSQVSGFLVQDRAPRVKTSHFYPPEPHQLSSNPTSIPRNNIAKSTSPQDNCVILKQENPVREALFSTAGRRYGRGRFSRRPGNNNLIGRDGKRMRCRGCNSDEHFIADCNERDKPKLIAFANDLIGADALNYPGNQILEMIQELPDDIWDLFLSSQVDMQHEADQLANEMEPKEAMFASLADNAAMHEFIGPKALNDIQDRLHIGDPSPRTLSL